MGRRRKTEPRPGRQRHGPTRADAQAQADAKVARQSANQAYSDAAAARQAANQAEAEAARARGAAAEADQHASAASSAANLAEKEAAVAQSAATQAEEDATAAGKLAESAQKHTKSAEEASKNANTYTEEADKAAQKAEEYQREQERKERQEAAKEKVKGDGSQDAKGQDIKIVMPNVGSSGLDVIGPNGEYVYVGGGAKAHKPSKFGTALKINKYAADQAGVKAIYYLADNTPQAAIDQAKKVFGEENVHIFTLPSC
ncbi:Chromosome partition protein Smc [Streptomyces hundungensis]|uniref:Chromosome partition protein Smc n=1 Tax=Streptomyces hundungensis TaxID=1077946 RepID=A0A387HNU3_9ACTN|nr:hypothetical protein [Streptomyces hundungensis]AYG85234.1 Chromosome partition protein Smc [Streptomyces hundungensis]